MKFIIPTSSLYLYLALVSFQLHLCLAEKDIKSDSPPALTLKNVIFGNNSDETMDIYLPPGRHFTVSKIMILIGGENTISADKSSLSGLILYLKTILPRYAIVILNIGVGSEGGGGFFQEVKDLQAAINFLNSKKIEYNLMPKYALFGIGGEGGFLASLYSYKFDKSLNVKIVVNFGGVVDLTDPSYLANTQSKTYLEKFTKKLIRGTNSSSSNSQNSNDFIKALNPIFSIDSNAAKTIAFYGNNNSNVPLSQAMRLEMFLDLIGVVSRVFTYQSSNGDILTDAKSSGHWMNKLKFFLYNYF